MPKLFINQINSYLGSNLVKILTDSDFSLNGELKIPASQGLINSHTYQLLGTLSPKFPSPKNSPFIQIHSGHDPPIENILSQDIVIYNIVEDPSQIIEAEFVVRAMHENIGKFHSSKLFVLISNYLSWSKTRTLDPEDPERPFIEEDYRMRRPHPSYKEHLALEKLVTKYGRTDKSIFNTYNIVTGLLYGSGEADLHFLFRLAWLGGEDIDYLPIFGNGLNVIPMIHVKDISSIVQFIITNLPKTRYILAVDNGNNNLDEIVRSLSKEMWYGEIRNISREEAFLINGIDQYIFDLLTVSLKMNSTSVKDYIDIPWICESGFVDHIASVVAEYKKSRNLLPIRLCIIGPPAAGKTRLAAYLSDYYQIPHIIINDVIQEQILQLKNMATRIHSNGDENAESRSEQAKELLERLNENALTNSGRYDDEFIIDFYHSKLSTKECQNKGFVLDGYPLTFNIAQKMFRSEGKNIDSPNEDNLHLLNIPSHFIVLEAKEQLLRQRIIHLNQDEVEGTHNNEEDFVRRYEKYINLNLTEPTIVQYFDEREIEIIYLEICDYSTDILARKIISMVGYPKNFGPSKQELETMIDLEKEKNLLEMEKIAYTKRVFEIEEVSRVTSAEAIWTAQKLEIGKQKNAILECRALPLRSYIMKYVMPTLTSGLSDIVKIRPSNPIDYLAEFLFKTNPFLD